MKLKCLILLVWLIFPNIYLLCQISTNEIPPSFNSHLKSVIKSEFVHPPDMEQIRAEDLKNEQSNKPYRVAKMIDSDFCFPNIGSIDTLASGEIIWRFQIYAPDALGLQLNYANFYLPPGAKLFLYGPDKKFVIGAFTDSNNTSSGDFSTEIIPGENCTLELVMSPYSVEKPRFCIDQIGYVYRGINFLLPGISRLKASGACQVNINCSPEGDNWQTVKRSVARIYMNGYICSGNLINNTSNNLANFFTTAFHCIEGIENTSANWIFYFNHERTTCSNTSTLTSSKTITGATIRASTPIDGGGDGALLELSGSIPATYKVYYSGWDRNDSSVFGGACIHHPSGDTKKISTIRDKWYTSTWHGTEGEIGAENAHWYVTFHETLNGHGTTEGGSSGSGIFGSDELLRGTLSGGNSSCDVPSGSNLFGKLSYNWDQYSNNADNQFKPWLDPTNTGLKRVRGIDPNNLTAFPIYWTSSNSIVDIDSSVTFIDETLGSSLTRHWSFSGGTPSTSTDANPVVYYAEPGLYDVTLEINDGSNTYSKTRTDYVYVKAKPSWIVQNTHFPMPSRGIQGISIIDSLNVWAWAYDGLNPVNLITEYCKTTDGGKLWVVDSLAIDTLRGYGIANLFAINKDTVFASIFGPNGGGKIIKSNDGGGNWQVQTSALYNAPDGFPNFVYFFNNEEGICCGDPNNGYYEIYRTTDGGLNWIRVPAANIPANLANETGTTNMYDSKGDTIWFGTSAGRVFRSINKGANWSVSNTGLSNQTTVKFKNALVGFAISQGTSYAIKKTIDGGNTWSSYTLPPYFLKGDLLFIPGTKSTWLNVSSGYPSGSSYTIDDGVSFSSIDVGTQYTTVAFYNDLTGWAGGFNIDSIHGGIYKWDKSNLVLTSINDEIDLTGNETHFKLYPNPVYDVCNIISHLIYKETTGYIYNIQGKCVRQFSIPSNGGYSSLKLFVSDLASGIYLLNIIGENINENIKFVKY